MSDMQSNARVEYRAINGFPKYRVGSDGTVWSEKTLSREWKLLGQKVTERGYHNVTLSHLGRAKCFRVNRVVALAFIDNPSNKPEVNHKDGNKSNNSVNNLEWATRSENELHAFRIKIKVPVRGEQRHTARLSNVQAMDIARRLASGERVGLLASEFGVHQTTISDIKLGRSWTHLRQGGVP